jgi:hypothetical protein
MMITLMRKAVKPFSIALYMCYFVSGSAFLFAQSPSLNEFIGSAYMAWSVLLWIGGGFLVVGMLTKRQWIEVIGTLPTSCSVGVYALSLVVNPPLDQRMLGLAVGCLVFGSALWLVIRFLVIYPNLGNNDRRKV